MTALSPKAAFRHCHEKTSYVLNFALSFYCMNGSIEGRCTNHKNSSVCNSDFIARSVLLEFFKVMSLPSIDLFMQLSEKCIIWYIGGFLWQWRFVRQSTSLTWQYHTDYKHQYYNHYKCFFSVLLFYIILYFYFDWLIIFL